MTEARDKKFRPLCVDCNARCRSRFWYAWHRLYRHWRRK